MIPQETVNAILDATHIEDVIGDFVSLKRSSSSFVACCPFHNEKTPSFHVSPAKNIYKCFGCGKSGGAVTFLMEHEHCSYVEALKYLAAKYHIEVQEEELSADEIARRQKHESLLLVSEFAQQFFVEQLSTPEGKAIAMTYYHSRGLEDATIATYGLGWAPSGKDSFTKAALAKGYKEEYLIECGLSLKKEDGTLIDRFRERVMFPIHSVSGRVVAFSGRTLKSDNPAKYVNSQESEIYVKSRNLLGIFFAKAEITRENKCYLVEGNVDVITMQQLGVHNVVASCGTSLTPEQIRLIKRFTSNLTIMYDGDKAGIKAALRGIDLVLAEGMNVRVVLLPEGEDPDSFGRSHTLAQVQQYIAEHEVDFISFKTDLLLQEAAGDIYKKSALINDIADSIAKIPDGVQRNVYTDQTARRFDIDPAVLYGRVDNTRRSEQQAAQRNAQRAQNQWQPASAPRPQWVSGAENAPAVQPQKGIRALENDPIVGQAEMDILHFLLKYGDQDLVFEVDSEYYQEGRNHKVWEFIHASHEEPFYNTIYNTIYDQYVAAISSGVSQKEIIDRLINSEDSAVAQVTSAIYIDKYEISVSKLSASMMTTESWLAKFVPQALFNYADRCFQSHINALKRELAGADPDRQMQILTQLSQLQKARLQIKKTNR